MDAIWRSTLQRASVHGAVSVGEELRLGLGASVWSAHGLAIGDFVAIGRNSLIEVDGAIGHFVMMASGVQVVGRSDHSMDELGVPMRFSTWIGDRERQDQDGVVIGDDVWIGAAAIILSGISIGSGAVVAAGAVVVHDVPAFALVAGVPAREVGLRFGSERQRVEHLEGIARFRDDRLRNLRR